MLKILIFDYLSLKYFLYLYNMYLDMKDYFYTKNMAIMDIILANKIII